MEYDFTGWATRNDIKCSDGRTIRKNAFAHNDGKKVPLVWNHQHNDASNVLGYAVLENRPEGVYAYGKFNDTDAGINAKKLVQHGDIRSLSIYANKLKQKGGDVLHGEIRELSLVLAGANVGAYIDEVLAHGEGEEMNYEAIIYNDAEISLEHAEKDESLLEHADKEETEMAENEKTVQDVFDTLNEEQKTVVYALIGEALKESDTEEYEDEDGGEETMKHNAFENEYYGEQEATLSHSDMVNIVGLAKNKAIGTLQNAIEAYTEDNETLAHGFEQIDQLFPDYQDVPSGMPALLERDQSWVSTVMQKVKKSPFSRIRTRQFDVRDPQFAALGYKKGAKKNNGPNIKLLKRTTDPQTVYRKDALHRDDIVDITDFDVVGYQYGIMKSNLEEEIAKAILIGDGREEGSADKISEDHIRPIWTDDELYTIHVDVDLKKARAELQGTNTGANFGENYVYAEAIITAALYSREKFKGSGTPDFYCTPHLLNIMLLARDLNGRRIYESKNDLAAALNVGSIITIEQLEGKTRTTTDTKTKKLLGLFVNLADYQIGSTKGGEITKFKQFDIDFNQEKYLIETRLSGALTKAFSAIALEEDVTVGG